MTERDPRADAIEAAIPGLTVHSVGGACPVQLEATTADGENVYFRYRFDAAQLYVGFDDDISRENTRLYAELDDVFNDPMRGFLDDAETTELFLRLWAMLKPPQQWPEGTRMAKTARLLEALLSTPPTPDET